MPMKISGSVTEMIPDMPAAILGRTIKIEFLRDEGFTPFEITIEEIADGEKGKIRTFLFKTRGINPSSVCIDSIEGSRVMVTHNQILVLPD